MRVHLPVAVYISLETGDSVSVRLGHVEQTSLHGSTVFHRVNKRQFPWKLSSADCPNLQ
jgi:hypothetical protein